MSIDNIKLRIQELNDEGITVKVIRAHLTIEGFSDKDITAALKAEGITGKKRGFAADFYDWLAEEPRDDWEVKDYIMGDGGYDETSDNVKKHLSHYTEIAKLAQRIWNK